MKFFNIVFFIGLIFVFNTAFAVKKMNPDISVNVLLLGKKTFSEKGEESQKAEHQKAVPTDKKPGTRIFVHNEGHDHGEGDHHSGEGFSVQEVEFYFKSNIDPYWTGNVSLGIAQHGNNFELDLEEAYVESLFVPSLTLKAGKFYASLGRHNILHTHYYPFIDPPLVNQKLFGFHGWNNTGISMAYLTPLPWYSEIILQGFYKYEKKEKFHNLPPLYAVALRQARAASKQEEYNPFAGILFLKNLWDLSDSSTLELDLSYGSGVKTFKHLYNASLVWKWKALESVKKRSLSWTTEWMQVQGDSASQHQVGGVGSYVQWQFLNSWWLEGRAEYLSYNKWKDIETQKYSFLVSFAATEYSAIRLQYDIMKSDQGEWGYSVAIQSNMSLGAHPAHLY